MSEWSARVILLAGPSGSGKSYIARQIGLPILCLDDFYKDSDDPTLPRSAGMIDWDSTGSWDGVAALAAIEALAATGATEVPHYSISANRAVGRRTVRTGGAPLFVAEGIFAAELAGPCGDRDLLAAAYVLRRGRLATFARRLTRDLTERRKSPGVLVRRGVALLRDEPAILAHQVSLGCQPVSVRDIRRAVSRTPA